MAYLDFYLRQVAASTPIEDPLKLEKIRSFHGVFVDDIRTQDKAQGMISKMIGKDTARRIFYEVTT